MEMKTKGWSFGFLWGRGGGVFMEEVSERASSTTGDSLEQIFFFFFFSEAYMKQREQLLQCSVKHDISVGSRRSSVLGRLQNYSC